MIHYTIYQKNPASHYIYIDMVIPSPGDSLHLQLPAWRPGRYELGNFARNIKRVDVFDQDGKPLKFTKSSKDHWIVASLNAASVKVTYSYYAAELTAGSCFADESQIYVNPVHCCMYVPDRMEEAHVISLVVPDGFRIVGSMARSGKDLKAAGFDELADSPFIASGNLNSEYYEVDGIKFHLHFNGECRPEFSKIKKDFSAFTKCQLDFWKTMPVNEFHFLFQVLPVKYYHGVEHLKSTVIALGPGYALNSGTVYEDLLGVSSHELFHVWNVKTIRPFEMQPYNYAAENYARTGYVYEGFTSYYGDKLLLTSGVFNEQEYFVTLCERLQKHFHNSGRFNLGVAQSSWETWLDGYVPGAPYRKTSIYDEGNLVAFILDVRIMQATSNKRSLRDVCLLLYERFGKTSKGYTEADIISLVNEVAGTDLTAFFNDYVNVPADYEPLLTECFSYLGITFTKAASAFVSEELFGFKSADNGQFSKVTLVAPYSPAWRAGLFQGDEVLAVNGKMVRNNFNHWMQYYAAAEKIILTVNSNELLKTIELIKDPKGRIFFFTPQLSVDTDALTENFKIWKRSGLV
jgi:predicted metalloprotease with PDZ domain